MKRRPYLSTLTDDLSNLTEEQIRKEQAKIEKKLLGDTNLASKPETEQELFILQLLYTTTRNPEIWNIFFSLVFNYTRSILLKINKGKVFLDPEIIDDKTNLATIQFLERYDNPEFRVIVSFGGTIKWPCVGALWGDKKEDIHYSLNSILDSTKKEFGESQDTFNFTPLTSSDVDNPEENLLKVDYFEEIKRLLAEYDQSIDYNNRLMMLARIKIIIALQKNKSRHVKDLFEKFYIRDPREGLVLDTVLLELQNRLRSLQYVDPHSLSA